jgi:hypothetical protein
LAFFKIRLRRARLAGALVALGIVVRPELLRSSSFSELFVPLSIFATSLADAVPFVGLGAQIVTTQQRRATNNK